MNRFLPVSAPIRVRDRLQSTDDGIRRVIHRGQHALYIDLDGQVVGIVAASASAVPCALRMASPDLSALGRQESVEVRDGDLYVDGIQVRIGRLIDVTVPPRHDLVPGERTGPWRTHSDPSELDSWVGSLIGHGDGLTPYGDDVLCGYLALHRSLGLATDDLDAHVRGHAHRTTQLSATLLECAIHGEVMPEFAQWVRTLESPAGSTPDSSSQSVGASKATAALRAIGHSSGRGLHEGAVLALRHLHERNNAA